MLDTEHAADEMSRIGKAVVRRASKLAGAPVTFALFVFDETGGCRFVHNFQAESRMMDAVSGSLAHGQLQ